MVTTPSPENNSRYVLAALLRLTLREDATLFKQSEVIPKPIVARQCTFSRALCRLRVITSSFDWFTGLSPSFLIAKVITLVLVLRYSIETRSMKIAVDIVVYASAEERKVQDYEVKIMQISSF